MKSIMYISRVISRQNGATVPGDLSKIYTNARRANLVNGITGVLSYRVGYYIQVIEGDDNTVDKLYAKIVKDNRHLDPVLIFDMPISERFFGRWSMKLLRSANRSSVFRNFIDANKHRISELSNEQQALLNKFCSVDRVAAVSYKDKQVKLSGWPDFTSIEQTTSVIELCAAIMHAPKSYEVLVNSGAYGNASQLNALLDEFLNQDILSISRVDNLPEKEVANSEVRDMSFYSKMKSFLGLRRTDGI